MKPQLRIATWNVEGRLSSNSDDQPRSTPNSVLNAILALDADVVYLPEAFRANEPDAGIIKQMKVAGFYVFVCAYNDIQRLRDDPGSATHSLVMSKVPFLSEDVVGYDTHRNLPVVRLQVGGCNITIAGMHLDDRGEAYRLTQTAAVVERFSGLQTPLILLGDFNATHHTGMPRVYRSRPVRLLGKFLPHPFIRSMILRMSEMSTGDTLRQLQESLNVQDADVLRRPTATPKLRGVEWLPSIRILQLDHILHSKHVTVRSVSVLPDGGSDHRAVLAEITLDKS